MAELEIRDLVIEYSSGGYPESGEVEIVRTRTDGTEERVAVINTGSYFGELAPLFGLRRSAAARALGPAVVTGCSVADFRSRVSPSELSGLLSERHP